MQAFIPGAGATGGLLAQLLRRRSLTVWCGDRDPGRARNAPKPFRPVADSMRPLRARLRVEHAESSRKSQHNSAGMNPAKKNIEPVPDSMDEPVLPENTYEDARQSPKSGYAGRC